MTASDQYFSQAGPLEAPLLRRSQYLTALLQQGREGAQSPRSGKELAVRLLAEGLAQYAQNRNDRRLQEARTADLASNPVNRQFQLMFGGQQQPQQPPGDVAGGLNGANAMVAALTGGTGTATRSTAGDPTPPPPAPPQAGMDPETRDLMARLLIGEAPANGQQAVANVVFNRSRSSGMTPGDVIRAPHQFEPYGNRQTWQRLSQIPQDDPRYQQALQAIEAAQAGDVTGGATHFYSPQTQAALGRQPPAWANGQQGTDIGGNRFFNLPYSAPPGYQAPPSPAPQAQGGAPPAAPVPPPVPGAGGQPPMIRQMPPQQPQTPGGVTQQEIAYVQALMADPRTRQQGLEMAQALTMRAVSPPSYESNFDASTGMTVYRPRNPGQGQPYAVPTQGFTPNPATLTQNGVTSQYDPRTGPAGGLTPAPIPQQAMTRPAQPNEMQGITPGSGVDVSPYGSRNVVQSPPTGYAGPGGSGGALAGGPADPRSPMNRAEGLRAAQGRIQPIMAQATQLRRNIEAVRVGVSQNNGAGDIAAINGLQRLIDEGVVREGDVALQLRGQGINGGIAGLRGYLTSNGFFSPQIRAQLSATAEALYSQIDPTLREQVLGQRRLLDETYGPGSFDLVAPPDTLQTFGWSQPAQGQRPQPHGQQRTRSRIISVE